MVPQRCDPLFLESGTFETVLKRQQFIRKSENDSYSRRSWWGAHVICVIMTYCVRHLVSVSPPNMY